MEDARAHMSVFQSEKAVQWGCNARCIIVVEKRNSGNIYDKVEHSVKHPLFPPSTGAWPNQQSCVAYAF